LSAFVQGISLDLDEELEDSNEQRDILQELISNSRLSEGYLTLARDLDVMEPKTPDDIYKVC
jgi:26S proteasome regulatory subunit N1